MGHPMPLELKFLNLLKNGATNANCNNLYVEKKRQK